MKKFVFSMAVVGSMMGFASNEQVRSDMQRILEDEAITRLIRDEAGYFNGIRYVRTLRCVGAPSDYKLTFSERGEERRLTVRVGTCRTSDDQTSGQQTGSSRRTQQRRSVQVM